MFVISFTALAIAGILAGTYLVRFVSQRALRRAFALFLLGLGALILYQNRSVFMPSSVAETAGRLPASTNTATMGDSSCC